MPVHAHTESAVVGTPQSLRSPFSPTVDAQLTAFLDRLDAAVSGGVDTFAVVTHREPDPDAVAASLGFQKLVRTMCGPGVSVRCFHEGECLPTLRSAGDFRSESMLALSEMLTTTTPTRVAVAVVDAVGLHSGSVLSENSRSFPGLLGREADFVVDHHCSGDVSNPAHLIVGEAGSASCICKCLLVRGLLTHAQKPSTPSHAATI